MAKGLDCGTSYYITATENSIKKQRNVFLTVDGDEMKEQKRRFADVGGVVGIHSLGQIARKFGGK